MYRIEEPETGVLAIWHGDQPVARLQDGTALTMALTYVNLNRLDPVRAQDFLHGIVLALSHVVLTNTVPVVTYESIL